MHWYLKYCQCLINKCGHFCGVGFSESLLKYVCGQSRYLRLTCPKMILVPHGWFHLRCIHQIEYIDSRSRLLTAFGLYGFSIFHRSIFAPFKLFFYLCLGFFCGQTEHSAEFQGSMPRLSLQSWYHKQLHSFPSTPGTCTPGTLGGIWRLKKTSDCCTAIHSANFPIR